jgi:hypothetical protein
VRQRYALALALARFAPTLASFDASFSPTTATATTTTTTTTTLLELLFEAGEFDLLVRALALHFG